MDKAQLQKEVAKALEADGFKAVSTQGIRSHVDIVAQKRGEKVMVKIVRNIDAITKEEAETLYRAAKFLDSRPVVAGLVSHNGKLEKGMRYSRFSIECFEASDLVSMLESTHYVASKSCGVKVLVDGLRIKKLRKLKGLSMRELAQEAHISASAIYKHERSCSFASLELAQGLESVLGSSITLNVEIEKNGPETKPRLLGSSTVKFITLNNSPFGMLAKGNNYYPVGFESDARTMQKKALFFKDLRNSFENNFPFFVSKHERAKDIDGIRVVPEKRLSGISSEDELLELV